MLNCVYAMSDFFCKFREESLLPLARAIFRNYLKTLNFKIDRYLCIMINTVNEI